eukprot:TRINITY_DN45421_c0_g1_i2.p1 TRINITY_DN45421_c0_g1~~TRINITY_DN45421_c0_g1_i2.p1  ORF type:complete len:110 (-),score=7.35 TRINITY_DN45421_c0_g1_i2:424-714(-)
MVLVAATNGYIVDRGVTKGEGLKGQGALGIGPITVGHLIPAPTGMAACILQSAADGRLAGDIDPLVDSQHRSVQNILHFLHSYPTEHPTQIRLITS